MHDVNRTSLNTSQVKRVLRSQPAKLTNRSDLINSGAESDDQIARNLAQHGDFSPFPYDVTTMPGPCLSQKCSAIVAACSLHFAKAIVTESLTWSLKRTHFFMHERETRESERANPPTRDTESPSFYTGGGPSSCQRTPARPELPVPSA